MTQLVLTGSVLLFIYLAFFFSQLILFLICYGTVFAFTFTVLSYGPSGSVLLYLLDPSLDPDLGSRAASQSHVLFMNTHHCNTENITFVSVAAKLRFP